MFNLFLDFKHSHLAHCQFHHLQLSTEGLPTADRLWVASQQVHFYKFLPDWVHCAGCQLARHHEQPSPAHSLHFLLRFSSQVGQVFGKCFLFVWSSCDNCFLIKFALRTVFKKFFIVSRLITEMLRLLSSLFYSLVIFLIVTIYK